MDIAGYIPTPGHHPEGRCEFKVDLNGDAVEDLTYRITFDEPDSAGRRRFVPRGITGADGGGTIVAEGVPVKPSLPRQDCGFALAKRATRSESSRQCIMKHCRPPQRF
jgi:hypothetical protein